MQPITLKELDVLTSDPSLFTLVDVETQTDPKKPLANAVFVKPGKSLECVDYESVRATLSESEIIGSSSRKEKVQQHKNEVLNTNSSLGSFLSSKVFQRESGTRSNIHTWKLDESEKDYPSSGYVYVPCIDTKIISNNNSVIVSNQQQNDIDELNYQSLSTPNKLISIDARDSGEKELEATCVNNFMKQNHADTNNINIKENIAANLLKDIEEKEFTNIRSVVNINNQNYPETDNSKVNDVILIGDDEEKEITNISSVKTVDEQNYAEISNMDIKENNKVNLVIDNDETEINDLSSANNVIDEIYPETHDINLKENYNIHLISDRSEKSPKSDDMTLKENITDTFLRENGEKDLTESSVIKNINDQNNPMTENSIVKENIDMILVTTLNKLSDINVKNSQETKNTIISNLVTSDANNSLIICKETSGKELKEELNEENKTELCNKEPDGETDEVNAVQKSTPILTHNIELECPDNSPERDTKLKNLENPLISNVEFSQKVESEQILSFVDERLNDEFISEDYVFNDSGQQPPIYLEDNLTVDEYPDATEDITLKLNSELNKPNAISSSTPDKIAAIPGNSDASVKEEPALNIIDKSGNEEQTPSNTDGERTALYTKLMAEAGTVIASLNKHINMDKFSYFQKREDADATSDKRIVDSRELLAHNHNYVAPPSLFTAVKSKILGFFGFNAQPPSASSSGVSIETSDEEDP